ncbi:DMT family transporter [uncultured Roseobacter sp.]|uniref:DMT family transporter n=1 Tax=uncultured Roseobacter sp. TaxID=114847 RepID=UPI002632E73A|nr:DMT family transporter [uncultured Roseobacter sp.]
MQQEQLGKLLRIGGAAATVGVVACVHAAADLMPLGQIMAMRAAISGVLILIYGLLVTQKAGLWPNRWRPHLVRGALACLAMLLSYVAFARLPVAQAQTLMFLAPLIAVPLATVQLGETLSKAALIGLGFGFVGTLFILGVSADLGPHAMWGAVCGIAAAVLVATIQITIRAMMATETAISTALSFTLIVAVVSTASVLFGDWIWPQGEALWILLSAGVFGALNLVLFAESLARAPVSTLAPLDYTGLIWALLADWLIFAVQPGGLSLVGSVLVTVGALIVVLQRKTSSASA